MKPKIAKFAIRAVGMLATLLGGVLLCFTVALVFMQIDNLWSFETVFFGLSLLISVWLLWIGYLVCFQFSPLAVQQACGALGAVSIFLFLQIIPWGDKNKDSWYTLGFLGWTAFVVAAYPVVSRYLIGILFPVKRESADFMPPLPKR